MILDYDECQRIMDGFDKDGIKETTPIGYTSNERLPIRHFTLGNGDKSIVVVGSQHANEIITVTFVLNLMLYLEKNNIVFEDLTIHFIPILNPEGYLINTSAIRDLLSKDANDEQAIKFSFDYYKRFRSDVIAKDGKIKSHQLLFQDTNQTSIDSKYVILRDKVGEILAHHPKGSIINWASNGNGVDLNSNTRERIVSPMEVNKHAAYNNIRLDIPSPIGYPGNNQSSNFTSEVEIISLKALLDELKDNCFGLLNYHSVGGMIYQRPESDDSFINIYNYLLSKFYQEYTKKNDGKYNIINEKSGKAISVDDKIRVTYPGHILIELSPMMGNPIGPFGDINNYNSTMESNIASFVYTMTKLDEILSASKRFVKEGYDYDKLDEIYESIKKRH